MRYWISSTGLSPSVVLLSRRFDYPLPSRVGVLQPRNCRNSTRFGLVPFRSPLLRESLLFSFPPGTEMFHFPGFASLSGYPASGVGCPIRTSADSRLLTSPRSFSQLSHVLLRLLVPRHPPCALSNLTKKLSIDEYHINRKVYTFTKNFSVNAFALFFQLCQITCILLCGCLHVYYFVCGA